MVLMKHDQKNQQIKSGEISKTKILNSCTHYAAHCTLHLEPLRFFLSGTSLESDNCRYQGSIALGSARH
jgi:hypothetical protein